MPYQNPFFHRGPIRDRAHFFGRQTELRQLLSLVGNGQSISLIGQRRIGKTSLLFQAALPEVLTDYDLNPANYLFVYIDCGELTALDHEGIYQTLLEEINRVVTETRTAGAPMTYRLFERSLRDLFSTLNATGHVPQLIICLDEFELLSRNPTLTPDFFSGLRALASRYPIAFITASGRPLLELTYANSSTLSSPFFNIFATIRLELFSEGEARELLYGLAHLNKLNFSEMTATTILKLAGPHPFFLQMAGYHAIEIRHAKGVTLTGGDYPILENRFQVDADEHYAYYWRNLTTAEQRILFTLPAFQYADQGTARILEQMRRLEQKALIKACGVDCYEYLSASFRNFVQNQTVPGFLQAGPVAIDEPGRQAMLRGASLDLTELQYALLVFLIKRSNQVVTTSEIERALWGDQTHIDDPERLKSVIKGLRRVLGDDAIRLENVRGVGYLWRL